MECRFVWIDGYGIDRVVGRVQARGCSVVRSHDVCGEHHPPARFYVRLKSNLLERGI